jgi:hypothetical protein
MWYTKSEQMVMLFCVKIKLVKIEVFPYVEVRVHSHGVLKIHLVHPKLKEQKNCANVLLVVLYICKTPPWKCIYINLHEFFNYH